MNLAAYIVVVSGLAVLNFNRNPENLWFLWIAGGWEMALIAHAASFVTNHDRMVAQTTRRMELREDLREERSSGERNAME